MQHNSIRESCIKQIIVLISLSLIYIGVGPHFTVHDSIVLLSNSESDTNLNNKWFGYSCISTLI